MGKVRSWVLTHWEGLWSYIRGCITCDSEKRSRPTWDLWRDAWINLDQIWHGATFFWPPLYKDIETRGMFSTGFRPFGIDLQKMFTENFAGLDFQLWRHIFKNFKFSETKCHTAPYSPVWNIQFIASNIHTWYITREK